MPSALFKNEKPIKTKTAASDYRRLDNWPLYPEWLVLVTLGRDHHVCLVKHEHFDLLEVDDLHLDGPVHQCAGGANHNLVRNFLVLWHCELTIKQTIRVNTGTDGWMGGLIDWWMVGWMEEVNVLFNDALNTFNLQLMLWSTVCHIMCVCVCTCVYVFVSMGLCMCASVCVRLKVRWKQQCKFVNAKTWTSRKILLPIVQLLVPAELLATPWHCEAY